MPYLVHILTLAAGYSILAMSLNLLVGYTGLLSVTHMAWNATGAYAVAILLTRFGWNFFPALLVGVGVAMTLAFFMSLVFAKFRDDYYALATVGFNIILVAVMRNWASLTRGPLGIPGIPRPMLFGFSFSSGLSFLILEVLAAVGVYFVCRFIVRSSFGRVLQAIRDDEGAIQVFGYNTYYYKLAIFVIAAGMAALAGGLFASYLSYIDPNSFVLLESIFILAAIILGGLANVRGAALGAVILIFLPEILRFVGFPSEVAAQMRQFTYGLMLVLLMLYRPQGILGKFKL